MSGKNRRMFCVDFCDGSLDGGEMIFWLAYWLTISSTGSTRYASASCHPIGGAPFVNGNSHDDPEPCSQRLLYDG